ncbi:MAG: hypothetical protein M1365_15005 [Actinobacteria bacterium]|nr:hypothetical protein [Actinomycetota bacterium]
MEEKEIIKAIKEKIKEVKDLRKFNSKDFKFKSWHVTTLNLLRSLQPKYSKENHEFKKLSFTDTKYHRDMKVSATEDLNKFAEDLGKAEEILKRIASSK